MSEILVIVAIASAAYIGTNLDNLLLLVVLYSRYEKRPVTVTAGYFAGMVIIGFIAFFIGEAGDLIPLRYLGMLGVIPMMMGIIALWKLFRGTGDVEAAGGIGNHKPLTILFAVISTQLANSADSIITFAALLADSSDAADYMIAPTFLAMIAVFSGIAYYSVKHPRLSQILVRYGQYVTPFILILIGFYILSNTASDLVPG